MASRTFEVYWRGVLELSLPVDGILYGIWVEESKQEEYSLNREDIEKEEANAKKRRRKVIKSCGNVIALVVEKDIQGEHVGLLLSKTLVTQFLGWKMN